MNPKVDKYIDRNEKWRGEVEKMRTIALDCGLDEYFKWGSPCYTFNNANVVLIHTFNEYCAYLFFKGVLLKDTNDILIQQTENVQAARQIRFTKMSEIEQLEAVVKKYMYQAVEIEKAGLEVQLKKTKEFPTADEFKIKLKEMPKLKKAFEALTPGRQRGYLLYFSSAKQSKTRTARVEKSIPNIMAGKGLNDN